MKKYAILAAVLVLTVSLLAGCGCTARDNGMATMPSATQPILPTNIPETTAPTEPATMPATAPATEATDATEDAELNPTQSDGGISDDAVSEPATRNRSRMR